MQPDNGSTTRLAARRRIVVGIGIVLALLIVAWAAYVLISNLLSGPQPAPTEVAAETTGPPAAVPASDSPLPTSSESLPPSPTPELGTSNVYIEYILDASGSMNETLPDGTLKLEVAKNLLTDHLGAFHPETNIGLRAYGHRLPYQQTEESCRDIELIAPVEKGQLETIVTWLRGFAAQGMTPLAESIRQAMADFVFEPGRINSIVMLSDGIETCEGDPCGLVEELKASGINFTIHVIGLDVDRATREQLRCIAEAGGGTYYDVETEQDLTEALDDIQETVTEEEVIVPPGANAPIVEGYPLIEDFDSDLGFTSTDPDVYIRDGRVNWSLVLSEDQQYVYRSIPRLRGDARLTVVAQVDSHSGNCYVRVGIGSGLDSQKQVALRFGYRGGIPPGYRVNAVGVVLSESSETNALLLEPGRLYTATLIIADSVSLHVDGLGTLAGTPSYTGAYDTLFIGSPGGAAPDPGRCSGYIERVIIEPLPTSAATPVLPTSTWTSTPPPTTPPTATPSPSPAVPTPGPRDMHFVVEIVEPPSPPEDQMGIAWAIWQPHIVEYLVPRLEVCDGQPYTRDPQVIYWGPNQDNVVTDLEIGQRVEIYGECFFDMGTTPAVGIPSQPPYFLRVYQP